MANAILVGERDARINAADVTAFTSLLGKMLIEEDQQVLGHHLRSVLPVARRYGLTVYDACYLELAVRRRAPLATQDKRLVRAARGAAVPLFLRQ